MSAYPPPSPLEEGGLGSLYDKLASVDCRVTNTGTVTSAEVVQLYLGILHGPARQLRGFLKKTIQPSQTENFHFDLTRRDLSLWDTTQQQWILGKGQLNIYVGASVLDIRLRTSLVL